MASIQIKKGHNYLVYDDPLAFGKRRQTWEPIEDGMDPDLVLAEFTVKEKKGKGLIKADITVEKLARQWVAYYGPKHWSYSTYNTNKGLIENHIIAEMGGVLVRDVTSLHIDKLLSRLKRKKVKLPKGSKKSEKDMPCLSSSTVRIIFCMLKDMFDCAVKWRIVDKDCHPVEEEARPAKNSKKRQAWSGRQCGIAMQKMQQDGKHLLHVIFHTIFACTLRNGEAMAITLDCINLKTGRLTINKTLQRVTKEALKKLPDDELLYVYPEKKKNSKMVLILKDPKTEASTRELYLPKQLIHEMVLRLNTISANKSAWGDDYQSTGYDLLFCQEDGSPIEPKLLAEWFRKWQIKTELGFPRIDIHGIRHSSVAHKVRISQGDFSSVKSDSGHTTMQMVTSYADHDFDEYREALRTSLEDSTFYNPDKKEEENPGKEEDVAEEFIRIMEKNPAIKQRVLQSALHALIAQQ